MTADIGPQRNQSGLGTQLPVLTLAFAALTLLFALLSMIFGSRLSTLQTNSLTAHNETAALGVVSLEEMKTALKTATVNLKTAQQSLETEKAAAHRLHKQISVLTEDLENTQVDLAKANQTITAIKSTGSLEPTLSLETPAPLTTPPAAPSVETILSEEAPVQWEPQPTDSPDPPAANLPEPLGTPAAEPQAEKHEAQVDQAAPSVSDPPSPDISPPVAEAPITDSPQELPEAAPAAD